MATWIKDIIIKTQIYIIKCVNVLLKITIFNPSDIINKR